MDILHVLILADIISEPIASVPVGYAIADVCDVVDPDIIEEYNNLKAIYKVNKKGDAQ
jgi:hypothetical protein